MLKVYYSSVSGNLQIKKQQQHIFTLLDTHQIPYTAIDISMPTHKQIKDFLRNKSPVVLRLPQIWQCGGGDGDDDCFLCEYEQFWEWVETGDLLQKINNKQHQCSKNS